MGLISRKLCRFLYVSNWLYFTQCLTSFSSINHLLCLHARFFNSISSNIDEVLSINPSANVFVFGDFSIYHKDWLTYSGGTDRSGELGYDFSIFFLQWSLYLRTLGKGLLLKTSTLLVSFLWLVKSLKNL